MLFIIYLLVIIKLSEGQIIKDGNCSVVKLNKNIDISKFTGEWYEVANIPNEYEQFVKCTSFNITLNSNKTIDIVVTALGSIGGNVFQWQGLGTKNDENSMSYSIEFPELAIKRKTALTIIDSDYVNYGILFMCQIVGELRFEYAWILSRKRKFNRNIFKHARKAFKHNLLLAKNLVRVDQHNCPSSIEYNNGK